MLHPLRVFKGFSGILYVKCTIQDWLGGRAKEILPSIVRIGFFILVIKRASKSLPAHWQPRQ